MKDENDDLESVGESSPVPRVWVVLLLLASLGDLVLRAWR
jgi:hypothetical protein